MKLEFGRSWSKKLQGRVEGYEFEVGVLEDKPHLQPIVTGLFEEPRLGSYAGGPIRKTSRVAGEASVGEVLLANMKRLNINILLRPFQEKNADILKFTEYFLRFVISNNQSGLKRLENLIQAIVRNPILKQEYGKNKPHTADDKGFDRHMFDTGQMFKSIRARAFKKGR